MRSYQLDSWVAIDALYERGWNDARGGKDYDPRKSEEWCRLEAESSEMLELVQYALEVSDEGLPLGVTWQEKAKAILAKAKGETE